jgi:hypothetical protein
MRAENAIQLRTHAAGMRAKEPTNVGFLRGAARLRANCRSAAGKTRTNCLVVKVLERRARARRDSLNADAADVAARRRNQAMKSGFSGQNRFVSVA